MIIFDISEFKKLLNDNMRLLCFDVGTVKIGTSLSDPSKTIANDYQLINLKKQKITNSFFSKLIEDQGICGIVVGYPLQMDGNEGNSCLMVKRFIEKYLIKLKLPIYLQDERLSTTAVNRYLKEMNFNRKKQEDKNDVAAASYILQIVLDKLINL